MKLFLNASQLKILAAFTGTAGIDGASEKGRSRIMQTIRVANGIRIGGPNHAVKLGGAKAAGPLRSHSKIGFG